MFFFFLRPFATFFFFFFLRSHANIFFCGSLGFFNGLLKAEVPRISGLSRRLGSYEACEFSDSDSLVYYCSARILSFCQRQLSFFSFFVVLKNTILLFLYRVTIVVLSFLV